MLIHEAWNFYREVSEEEEELKYSGLVKFFMDNPHPTEDQLEELSDELNISLNEVEERMFRLLSSLLRTLGKHNDISDDQFDQEQLQKGIEIEKEHTDDPLVAKMIAKDHLSEIPDYYSRLHDMEQSATQNDNQNTPKNRFSIRDALPTNDREQE